MKWVIPFLLVLCAIPAAHATSCSNNSLGSGITCVQSTSSATSGTFTISQAFGSNNTAGDFLTVSLGLTGSTPSQNFNCTDTQSNKYHLITLNDGSAGNSQLLFFYAENSASGANTVTCATASGGYALMIAIAEYSGIATSGSYDVSNAAGGNGAGPLTVSSGNMISTAATELQFSFGYDQSNGTDTFTPSAGFTMRENPSLAATHTMATFDKVVTSTGTYSNSIQINNTSSSFIVVLSGFRTTNRTLHNCSNTSIGFNITCIQAIDTWAYNTNVLTATYTNSANHLLLYICAAETSTQTIAFTDNNSNTITTIDSVSENNEIMKWAYVAKSNSGANTVTCTLGATLFTHVNLIVVEYSGISLTSPLDVHTTANSGGVAVTSQTTGSITTTGKDMILVVGYNKDNPSSYYPSGGYIPEYTSININLFASQGLTLGDGIQGTTGMYSSNMVGSSGRLDGMIAAFFAASGVRHKANIY